MAKNSNIAWTDNTFNSWIGCTKVSPGCKNCYADAQDKLRKWTPEGWGGPRRRTSEDYWKQPLKWNKVHICNACGEFSSFPAIAGNLGKCPKCHQETMRRPRVFCASLADWLDDEVPIEWLADLLKLIHDTPNLDWQLLTKRPQNWLTRMDQVCRRLWHTPSPRGKEREGQAFFKYMTSWFEGGHPPDNVWLGTSVEDQQRADERIPELLKIPARVRFLSCEPLLDFLHLDVWLGAQRCLNCRWRGFSEDDYCPDCGSERPYEFGDIETESGLNEGERQALFPIHQIIVGGESGPGHRPLDLSAMEDLAEQCTAAGVPFFCKQDSGSKPGKQGRLSYELFNRKEFPK